MIVAQTCVLWLQSLNEPVRQLLSTSRQFCNASLSFGFLSQFFICYLLSSWLKKHRLLLAVLPFFLSITEKTNNIRKKCERKQKDNEELQNSREVECSICRLWVHSKPTTTKHMFGLLSEWVLTFCYLALGNMTHSLKKNASAFLVCYNLQAILLCQLKLHFLCHKWRKTWYIKLQGSTQVTFEVYKNFSLICSFFLIDYQ